MLFGRSLIGVCDGVGALAAAPPRFEGITAARSAGRTGWTTEGLAGAPRATTTGLKDVTAEQRETVSTAAPYLVVLVAGSVPRVGAASK